MAEEKKRKPELYPNSKTGKEPDIEKIVVDPTDWLWSYKRDGGRLGLQNGPALNRSLKKNTSSHVQKMWEDAQAILDLPDDIAIEAEFYSPNMTFPEIMHFFKCSDITSAKTRKKHEIEWKKTSEGTKTYTKTVKGKEVEQDWEFPGRDVDWLCEWHSCLKFYAFNLVDHSDLSLTKEERSIILESLLTGCDLPDFVYVKQNPFEDKDVLYQAFDQSKLDELEGLVVMRKDCKYKYGRHSDSYKDTFKLKDDNLEFDAVILGVEESTVVKADVAKTINELGRSRTSQLQDDRLPSGMAKGFLVRLEDGQEMTVSLNGYDHPARKRLLVEEDKYIGKWIRFTAMAPVKVGGKPRHAHFQKGNFRDEK